MTDHEFFLALRWQEKRFALKSDLTKCLADDNFVSIFPVLNEVFSIIIDDKHEQGSRREWSIECLYRNAIYTFMCYSKIDIRLEEQKIIERTGLVLYHGSSIVLLEIKVSNSRAKEDLKSKLVDASEQMAKYAKSYNAPICICIVINAKKRQIVMASINGDVYKRVSGKKKKTPGTYERIGDLEDFRDHMQKSKAEV